MAIEQAVITWVHLVSAAIWVGGGLFLGVILAPVLKKTSMTPGERLNLMIRVGRRFNRIAVPSLIVLIATGLYNSQHILSRPDFLFGTRYGELLVIKMILVILVIIIFAAHVRIIRHDVEAKIMSGAMLESDVLKLRKKIIILGEAMSVVSVAILFLAAWLDAGV